MDLSDCPPHCVLALLKFLYAGVTEVDQRWVLGTQQLAQRSEHCMRVSLLRSLRLLRHTAQHIHPFAAPCMGGERVRVCSVGVSGSDNGVHAGRLQQRCPIMWVSDKENRIGKCNVDSFPCLFRLQSLYMDWTPPPPPLLLLLRRNPLWFRQIQPENITLSRACVWTQLSVIAIWKSKLQITVSSFVNEKPESLVRGDHFSLHIWGPGYDLQKKSSQWPQLSSSSSVANMGVGITQLAERQTQKPGAVLRWV